MIPRLEPPICGTRFFTSLLVSKGYLAMAHEPRAIMRMAEHLELVDPVDKLEALAEADTKRQYTHGLAEAINAEGGWGHWEKHRHGLDIRHSEAEGAARRLAVSVSDLANQMFASVPSGLLLQ